MLRMLSKSLTYTEKPAATELSSTKCWQCQDEKTWVRIICVYICMYVHMRVRVTIIKKNRLSTWESGSMGRFQGGAVEKGWGVKGGSNVTPLYQEDIQIAKMCIKVQTYGSMAYPINVLSWWPKNVTVDMFSNGVSFASLSFKPPTNSTLLPERFPFAVQTNVVTSLCPSGRPVILQSRHILLPRPYKCQDHQTKPSGPL